MFERLKELICDMAVLPAHNRVVAGSTPASGAFDILTVRISGRFFFCMNLERWWRWPTAKTKG